MVRALTLSLLAAALLAASAGATPTSAAGGRVFVGRESQSGAGFQGGGFVAIVTGYRKGKEVALAYACDSRRLAPWFSGAVVADGLDLHARGYRLTAAIHASTADGTLTLPSGRTVRFHVRRAGGRRQAGLYRAEQRAHGRRVVAGWIVLPDGEQRGAEDSFAGNSIGIDVVKLAPMLTVGQTSVQLAGTGTAAVTRVTSASFIAFDPLH